MTDATMRFDCEVRSKVEWDFSRPPTPRALCLYRCDCIPTPVSDLTPMEVATAMKENERDRLFFMAYKFDLHLPNHALCCDLDNYGRLSFAIYPSLEDALRQNVFGKCDVIWDNFHFSIIFNDRVKKVYPLSLAGECTYREALSSRKYPQDQIHEYALKKLLRTEYGIDRIDFKSTVNAVKNVNGFS